MQRRLRLVVPHLGGAERADLARTHVYLAKRAFELGVEACVVSGQLERLASAGMALARLETLLLSRRTGAKLGGPAFERL